jgi:hypothetical protein
VAESLHWAKELINAAATCSDPDLLIVGHNACTSAYSWLRNAIKTREHADEVLALYREKQHGLSRRRYAVAAYSRHRGGTTSGPRFMAAPIFAPTASLAARGGSAERCAPLSSACLR